MAVEVTPLVTHTSRVISATLRNRHLGALALLSVYLHQGIALAEGCQNDAVLKSTFYPLRDSGARVLAGGDWNNPPSVMANWLSQNNMPYVVVAQRHDTFVSGAGY